MFDGVLVLGKELRWAPVRAQKELKARAAAASAAYRNGAKYVATLESKLRGQDEKGSAIVTKYLLELGVDKILALEQTRSTREEAIFGAKVAKENSTSHLLVITSAYHVPRARRYFSELSINTTVCSPVSLLRMANNNEKTWILDGEPNSKTMLTECTVEAFLSTAARVLKPLPSNIRWQVEIMAGIILRDTK